MLPVPHSDETDQVPLEYDLRGEAPPPRYSFSRAEKDLLHTLRTYARERNARGDSYWYKVRNYSDKAILQIVANSNTLAGAKRSLSKYIRSNP